MGRKDSRTTKYLSDPEKCADLLNGIFYNGKPMIRSDTLVAKDTAGIVMKNIKS